MDHSFVIMGVLTIMVCHWVFYQKPDENCNDKQAFRTCLVPVL